MSDEYDYDDDKWEPSEKDELTAIKHTLKRMEVKQSKIYTALSFLAGMLVLIVLKFVFEMDSWLWT
mgnify:CR=1 FL=1